MKCENCQYWQRNLVAGNTKSGQCRRNAPKVSVTAHGMVLTLVPETDRDYWCGEFKPKENDQ